MANTVPGADGDVSMDEIEDNTEAKEIDEYLELRKKQDQLEKDAADKKDKKKEKKVKPRKLKAGVDFPKHEIPKLTKKLELDSEFVQSKSKLDQPPDFDEIEKYITDYPRLKESLTLLKDIY